MHHLNAHRTFDAIIAPAVVDPFARTRRSPARMHPRRDENGHGAPGGGGGGGGTGGADPSGGAGGGGGQQTTTTVDDAAKRWTDVFGDAKPEDIKAAVDQSRKWETRSKDNFEKAQQYDALAKFLSGDKETPPDPAQLTASLTAAQREKDETKRENAILRRAAAANGNPNRLVDSRSFMRTIDELDPSAGDFAEKLDAAIKAAVEADPSLAATAGAPGFGVHVPGEGGAPGTPPSLEAQIAQAEKDGDKAKATRLKTVQLAQLAKKQQ